MVSVPNYYRCSKCNQSGLKLWRKAQSFGIHLHCAQCLGYADRVDSEGLVDSNLCPGHRTDQLDPSFVPAVPDKRSNVEAYWGYTSVPNEDVQWWRLLPSK